MVARQSAKKVTSHTAAATRLAAAQLCVKTTVNAKKKRELKIEIRIFIILVLHCKKRTPSARLTCACPMGPTKYCLIRCIFCAMYLLTLKRKPAICAIVINIYPNIYYVNPNTYILWQFVFDRFKIPWIFVQDSQLPIRSPLSGHIIFPAHPAPEPPPDLGLAAALRPTALPALPPTAPGAPAAGSLPGAPARPAKGAR